MSFSSDIPGLQNQLPLSIELPDDLDGLRGAVNDLYQDIASTVNTKEGALYVPIEKLTSAQYFLAANPQQNRAVYRMVVDFGALPNTGLKSVPHGIVGMNSQYTATRIYGAATDPINLIYIPLPYASPVLAANIEMYVDATNVNITTGSNRSTFTRSTVVIEFTKTI